MLRLTLAENGCHAFQFFFVSSFKQQLCTLPQTFRVRQELHFCYTSAHHWGLLQNLLPGTSFCPKLTFSDKSHQYLTSDITCSCWWSLVSSAAAFCQKKKNIFSHVFIKSCLIYIKQRSYRLQIHKCQMTFLSLRKVNLDAGNAWSGDYTRVISLLTPPLSLPQANFRDSHWRTKDKS